MAGDWIKMRSDLFTHPKVVRMASALKADTLRTVGGLMSVWCLFDAHSEDGFMDGYSPEVLDNHLRWDGFSAAMISVGWLAYTEGSGLSVPDFDTHNGQSAKRRAQDADRKREVRKASASDADKKRTREEKRREEISPSLRSGDSAASRGSRLPDGWTLPDDWAVFCKAERPDLVPNEVAERFADYWHSAAGAKGRKSDWFATWRNWVRAEKKTAPAASETVYQRSMRERMQEAAPSIAKKAPNTSTNVIDFFEVEAKKLEDGHGPAIALG